MKRLKESEKKQIAEKELPLILSGEKTLTQVGIEYGISRDAVRRIMEDIPEYRKNKANIKTIKKSKKEPTLEQKENIKKELASKIDFLYLSQDEQENQVIKKFLLSQKDEKRSTQSAVETKIQNIIKLFEERNKKHMDNARRTDKKYMNHITEKDILYMLYRCPTMLQYSIEDKIKPVIDLLENTNGLDANSVSEIIKVLPSIFGYSIERTKKQLNILSNEHLTEAIIYLPYIMMVSPELMYALIQFAKQNLKTDNLSGIDPRKIFISSKSLSEKYSMNYEKIKSKYELSEDNNKGDLIMSIEEKRERLKEDQNMYAEEMKKILENNEKGEQK